MEGPADKDSLGRGVFYQYAYYGTITLAGAAFYLYVTHAFPTAIVGSVAILLAIVGLFPAFFTLGLQFGWQHFISYAIGEGNREEIARLKRQALKTGVLLGMAAVIFLLVSSRYISILFFHTPAYTTLILLLALDIPSAIMISIFNGLMLGMQRFRNSGIIGMTYVAIVYGSAAVLLSQTHSLDSVPVGWGIGYAAGVLLYYFELMKGAAGKAAGTTDIAHIFRYSLPLYATGILSYGAVYIDRLTVAFLEDLSSIGIYTLVLLIVSGAGLLSAPLGGIIFSKFSEFHAKNDKEMIREGVRVSVNAASILYIPAALGLSALSVPVLRLLGGSAYLSGALPLVIILTVNAVFIAAGALTSALQGTRQTRIFILSASLALLANFTLSILLIPVLRLVGAAIGYASVTVVVFLVVYYFARRAGIAKFDMKMISRVWISSLTMALLVFAFADVTAFITFLIPLYVITGIVAYVGMLRVTSALSQADKELLISLLPKSLGPLRSIVSML